MASRRTSTFSGQLPSGSKRIVQLSIAAALLASLSCGSPLNETDSLIASLADRYECLSSETESRSDLTTQLRRAERDLNNPAFKKLTKYNGSNKIRVDRDSQTADVKTDKGQLGMGIRYRSKWTLSNFQSTEENTVSVDVTRPDGDVDELSYRYVVQGQRVRLTLLEASSNYEPYPWTEVLAAAVDKGVVVAARQNERDSVAVWACRAQ